MELADVLDSKSSGGDTVPVRPRSPAPKSEICLLTNLTFLIMGARRIIDGFCMCRFDEGELPLYSAFFNASTISIFLFFLVTIHPTRSETPNVRRAEMK